MITAAGGVCDGTKYDYIYLQARVARRPVFLTVTEILRVLRLSATLTSLFAIEQAWQANFMQRHHSGRYLQRTERTEKPVCWCLLALGMHFGAFALAQVSLRSSTPCSATVSIASLCAYLKAQACLEFLLVLTTRDSKRSSSFSTILATLRVPCPATCDRP